MIYSNEKFVIAYKNELLQYELIELSIFEFMNIKLKNIKVDIKPKKEISISVYCNLCEKYHTYNYGLNEFIRKNICILGCSLLGEAILAIGPCEQVVTFAQNIKNYNCSVYSSI